MKFETEVRNIHTAIIETMLHGETLTTMELYAMLLLLCKAIMELEEELNKVTHNE